MSLEKNTTPLDKMIINLSQLTFFNNKKNENITSLCSNQLNLLRIVYISMIEDDPREIFFSKGNGTRTLSDEEAYLYNPYISGKVKLNYNQFLTILNQFARALEEEKAISKQSDFPNYFRNKFYRNIVVEHWERYFKIHEMNQGFSWGKNKAPIPSHESAALFEERKQLCEKLIDLFNKYNIDAGKLRDTAGQSILSTNKDYSTMIYDWLERIDPKLDSRRNPKIKKDLILALLSYGFPVPINDIEEYLQTLVNFINTLI